jgi:hypothetical protein
MELSYLSNIIINLQSIYLTFVHCTLRLKCRSLSALNAHLSLLELWLYAKVVLPV